MRVSGATLFSFALAVLAAWALLETRDWPIKTALYPRVVTIPLLLLALGEIVLSRRRAPGQSEQAMDFAMDTSVAPEVALRRTAGVVVWIGVFFAAVILLGFQVAVPLFVLAYLRGQGREGWVISFILAALAVLVFHALFVSLLHLPLPAGLLWRALGR